LKKNKFNKLPTKESKSNTNYSKEIPNCINIYRQFNTNDN